MQKIIPHLWFDKQAIEAAEFYVSVFGEGSKITSKSQLQNTPSGTVDLVSFTLAEQEFQAISAGPYFKFNPSVSLTVACETKEEVDLLWNKLIVDGMALMEIGTYPFSERYGWLQDKYGLSWQISYTNGIPVTQKITPMMMFHGNIYGKAEEAINFYTSIFKNSKSNSISKYQKGQEPNKEGTVLHALFTLENMQFAAIDSAFNHQFSFNEAISFIIHCEDQNEIDFFWEKLSAVPEAEQCGWLKDKYGLSWQVIPTAMEQMMKKGSQEQVSRLTQAFLQMKKFDLAKLKQAFEGKSA